jgi:hypothetical protein
MKKIIWPILHPIRFTPYLKDCWGFTCQKNILISNNKQKQYKLQDEEHFKEGVEKGYYEIFNAFYRKDNFLSHRYTTPRLSIALNTLQRHLQHTPPNLNFKCINIEILNTHVENGIVKSNEKILGLWTPKCIEQEIMIGMTGPEYQSIWHQQPIRKVVNVLYEFPDRKDIWTWQCSENSEQYYWNVKNINQILL